MDGTVFCRNEIVVSGIVGGEVDGKTSSVDEGHSTCLLLVDSSSIDVLLVRLSLAFQLLQIAVLKALLHGPFDDTAVTGD